MNVDHFGGFPRGYSAYIVPSADFLFFFEGWHVFPYKKENENFQRLISRR
jgi:hypothetical protein